MTKNNPGEFNCYERAETDEPMFVLLGRDPVASFVVRYWARLRVIVEENRLLDDQVVEALQAAEEMKVWAYKRGKEERVVKAADADKRLL